jgi:putative transposase
MRTSVSLYHRHRFPAEIISHCVWLYFRFALSFRDVEEMLAMRGVALTYETVRAWCLKFGQTYANDLRHKSPRPGDRWHLDEVFLKINGRLHYRWRAVDQDGDPLAPWGGFKYSGFGRENGQYGAEAFLETRAILES